jgi:predicted DNA-binding protein (MmcQ/YjbR family)
MPMNPESVRSFCLSLPHAAERKQWGEHLLFCVARKMFAIMPLEGGAPHCLSFKCDPETFANLIERPGIDPAPYSARYHWVALRTFAALSQKELQELLRASHAMVLAKLPRRVRAALESPAAPRARREKRRPAR